MIRLACAAVAFVVAAQTGAVAQYVGNVTGVVTDAATRRPVPGAEITVMHTSTEDKLTARTDGHGRFLIHSVPVEYPFSTYSVSASANGFTGDVLRNVKVLPGAVMALECSFALNRAGRSLSPHSSAATSFVYSHERAARASRAQAGKVFATREGLVGRTTANGHVIRSSDRFVALPSRRVLNKRGERKFLVRVAHRGRSATVPVWDIGPWNIKDDYWNESSERETFRSLRRGLPEAQAAYLDGFNGGRDGFGRKVLNPAGIDLSDAVFWRDLGMRDNDWITVEYLWEPAQISTRDPAPSGGRTRRTRSLRDIIAIAEAILIRPGR